MRARAVERARPGRACRRCPRATARRGRCPRASPRCARRASSTSAGVELEPEAPVEELVRLGVGEAQRRRRAARAAGRGRAACRAAAPGRSGWRARAATSPAACSTNQATLSRAAALDEPVEVVEHERDLAPLGERVDEPRQHDLEQRRRGERARPAPRCGSAGHARHSASIDVRPQHDGVVVALVERDPRRPAARRLALAPRRQQRRLAEAGRAGDEASAAARGRRAGARRAARAPPSAPARTAGAAS